VNCSICSAAAVVHVKLDEGCMAFEGARQQCLCPQHLASIEPIGRMHVLEWFTLDRKPPV
jgi:hypothetical protein